MIPERKKKFIEHVHLARCDINVPAIWVPIEHFWLYGVMEYWYDIIRSSGVSCRCLPGYYKVAGSGVERFICLECPGNSSVSIVLFPSYLIWVSNRGRCVRPVCIRHAEFVIIITITPIITSMNELSLPSHRYHPRADLWWVGGGVEAEGAKAPYRPFPLIIFIGYNYVRACLWNTCMPPAQCQINLLAIL